LDETVESFQHTVVDSGIKPAEDSIPVLLDWLRCSFDGLQSAMGSQETPLYQERFSGLPGLGKGIMEVEADVIGTTRFQIEFFLICNSSRVDGDIFHNAARSQKIVSEQCHLSANDSWPRRV
jgi:hypothetical protein